MTIEELEELRKDLRAVRTAIDRHRPLLREVVAGDFFARLSIPYALLVIAFGLGTHFLLGGSTDYGSLPGWWMPAFWAFLILLVLVGGIIKLRYLGRRASASGAGVWAVVSSIWGMDWVHFSVPGALAFVGTAAFALSLGHPWYLLSAASIGIGLALNGLGSVIRRPEYPVAGWYGVLVGIASLFSLEQAPWLWLAATIGGMLLVFGVGGLVPSRHGVEESGK